MWIFSTVPPKLNPFQSTVLQLNVGDRASLTCSVIKGDLPLTITWKKDNRIIDASQHISIKQVDHYNSILVIENLGPDHTGNYSCQTRNSAAEVEIAQSLLVNGKQKLYKQTKKKIVKKHTHVWFLYDFIGWIRSVDWSRLLCQFYPTHSFTINALRATEFKLIFSELTSFVWWCGTKNDSLLIMRIFYFDYNQSVWMWSGHIGTNNGCCCFSVFCCCWSKAIWIECNAMILHSN